MNKMLPLKFSFPHQSPGSHIAKDGPYLEQIAKLISKYPNLKYPDPERFYATTTRSGRETTKARCTAVRFETNTATVEKDFDSVEELESYLLKSQNSASSSTARRVLYLLEGTDPAYVATLGSALQVDPTVFARHQWTGYTWSSQRSSDTPPLPSMMDPARSFQMDYKELLYFPEGFDQYFLRHAQNERHISATSVDGMFEKVAAVQRKAAFWGRKIDVGGWEALLILDEPVREVLIGRPPNIRCAEMYNEPYRGGYADVIKYTDLVDACATPGPPRTSMYDDLRHYFNIHADRLDVTDDPLSATLILQRIIASHYSVLADYTMKLFEHMYWILGRQENYANRDVSVWAADLWSDLHTFDRRCQRDLYDLTAIVTQFGYADKASSQTGTATDFLVLKQRFEILRGKSQALFASFTSLTSIVGIRQSLGEARSVYILSILGILFLPLSFTSGLFSMAPDYLPGSSKFWIYFVVAIPVILGVFALPALLPKVSELLREVKKWTFITSTRFPAHWSRSENQPIYGSPSHELF